MDTVELGSGRDLLRRKVAHAQELLQRAASAATVHGDPVAPQLQAILYTLSTMTEISDDMRDTQTHFQGMLKANTEAIGKITPELAQSSALSITKELGPQLIHAALPTMRQALQTLRLKTLALSTMALVALCMVVGMLTYTAGLSAGRSDGEIATQTIQAAMKAGPDAALDWASLMQYNEITVIMKECRKNILKTDEGYAYCNLPVWLETPPPAPPAQH